MTHSLVEIPYANWVELRDLYNERRKEATGYGLLHTMINWLEKDSTVDIKMYALDGEWKSDGTFIIIQKSFSIPYIYFNTLSNDDLERLTAALNGLDTKLTYLLFAFSDRLLPAVRDHYAYAGVDLEQFKPESTFWYHIDKQKALQFEIVVPKDYKLLPLEEGHAEQINSIWPHRSPGSIEYVKCLIRLNDSVGLFDETGKLIAWCLRLPVGSLGLLQVIDSHKRKGLGNLVVRFMAKLIASKNEEVMAPVVIANTASRGMFEKLGFTIVDRVHWILKR